MDKTELIDLIKTDREVRSAIIEMLKDDESFREELFRHIERDLKFGRLRDVIRDAIRK